MGGFKYPKFVFVVYKCTVFFIRKFILVEITMALITFEEDDIFK